MKILVPVLALALAPALAAPASAAVIFDSSNSVNNDNDNTPDINELNGAGNISVSVSGNVATVTGSGAPGSNGGLGNRVESSNLNGPNQGALSLPANPGTGRTFQLSYDLFIPSSGANFRRDVPQVIFFDNTGEFNSNRVELFGFNNGADRSVTGQFQTVTFAGDVPELRNGAAFDARSAKFRINFEQGGSAGQNGPISAQLRNVTFDVSPVPEPASLALLAVSSVALLGRRRA